MEVLVVAEVRFKMAKVILTLHRKVGGEPKCICGSDLKYCDGWVCKKQFMLNEPKQIFMKIDSRKKFKEDEEILLKPIC